MTRDIFYLPPQPTSTMAVPTPSPSIRSPPRRNIAHIAVDDDATPSPAAAASLVRRLYARSGDDGANSRCCSHPPNCLSPPMICARHRGRPCVNLPAAPLILLNERLVARLLRLRSSLMCSPLTNQHRHQPRLPSCQRSTPGSSTSSARSRGRSCTSVMSS